MMRTPAQTVGPFFALALPYGAGPQVAPEWHPDAIRIGGQVLDGAGEPVPDALVELWQPDGQGVISRETGSLRRDERVFCGFGRCSTDGDGAYWFTTVKPGAMGGAAPYAALLVFARGLLKPVATRIYFPDDAEAHATDRVLSLVEEQRRPTLVAVRTGDRRYRFDIRLQGENETVFFAL
jgi:protocatechuate 3,4-dioxygenase, alpha subunit